MNGDGSDARAPADEPPDFADWEAPEDLLTDHPIRERLFDVVVQLREPTTVAAVAERVDCDTETARDYLDWFATMGLVTEYSGRPVQYALNPSYLRWRRVERIRRTHTEEQLEAELEDALADLQNYRERFDATDPDAVSLLDVAEEDELETVWETLSKWKTLRRRADLLDAARRDDPAAGDPTRIDA